MKNSGYKDDAERIQVDPANRALFVNIVRATIRRLEPGTKAPNRALWSRVRPLALEFNLYLEDDPDEGRLTVKEHLIKIRTGDRAGAIPTYLAWLCFADDTDGARNFYAQIGIPFRPYVGPPLQLPKRNPALPPALPIPPPYLESVDVRSAPQLRLSPPPESSNDTHYSRRQLDVLGREEEQETLRRFTSAGPGFRWLQLAGAGGQGKSRLAYELMLSLDGAWKRGFLLRDALEEFSESWRVWQPSSPHLIIVDDLLGFESQVGVALGALAHRATEFTVPVCVLLVERQQWNLGAVRLEVWTNPDHSIVREPDGNPVRELAPSLGRADWFSKANHASGQNLAHESYRFEQGSILLEALASGELVQMVRAILTQRGQQLFRSDSDIERVLASIDPTGSPLYAQILALSIYEDDLRPQWNAESLIDFALNDELTRRPAYAFADAPPLIADDLPAIRVALLATMVGFVDCDQPPDGFDHDWSDSRTRKQALALSSAAIEGGPLGPGHVVPALQPNLLGEWFVLSALQNGRLTEQLVRAAWLQAPSRMANFMARTVRNFPHHPATLAIFSQKLPTERAERAYQSIALAALANFSFALQDIPKQLVDAIEELAKGGDGDAMNKLGCLYLSGRGVEQNPPKALGWIRSAATSGNSDALNNLGVFYLEGHGGSIDSSKALEYLREGVAADNPGAMTSLALCYLTGRFLKRDEAEALQLLRRASSIGFAGAMNVLGECYVHGIGVEQDIVEAALWLRKAHESECLKRDLELVPDVKGGVTARTERAREF